MARIYPNRINWENYTSTNTPLNANNLNKMDKGLYDLDGKVFDFETTKANASDLLTVLSNVSYDTATGVFIFTWKNGTTKTIDLNIEKIPVSFSMSAAGVITMITADGTRYTADVSTLIKVYTFEDTNDIDFTVVTDASGNKTVKAIVKDGSVTESKLAPAIMADIRENADKAETNAEKAEGYAIGEQNGQPVISGEYFENNAKYYKEQASAIKEETKTLADYAKDAAGVSDFELDANGNLVYENNAVYIFTVDDNGMLNYEVRL